MMIYQVYVQGDCTVFNPGCVKKQSSTGWLLLRFSPFPELNPVQRYILGKHANTHRRTCPTAPGSQCDCRGRSSSRRGRSFCRAEAPCGRGCTSGTRSSSAGPRCTPTRAVTEERKFDVRKAGRDAGSERCTNR